MPCRRRRSCERQGIVKTDYYVAFTLALDSLVTVAHRISYTIEINKLEIICNINFEIETNVSCIVNFVSEQLVLLK